jgi:hypothetical protein
MWEPRRHIALWASTACYRDSFTFSLIDVVGEKPAPVTLCPPQNPQVLPWDLIRAAAAVGTR